MKKIGVLIMVALLAAVFVFSGTVFADQTSRLEKNKKTASVSQQTKGKKKTIRTRGTGVYKENGIFRYYKNGVLNKKTTGVAFCPEDGKFRYVKNGIFKKATGVAKNLLNGKWVYVKKGVFQKATRIAKRIDAKLSVYVKNGVLKKYTGLVKNQKGQWVLLNQGIVVTNPKQFSLTRADEKAGRKEVFCEAFARAVFQKAVTSKMTGKEKLAACFEYLRPKKHFYYLMTRIPYYTAPDSAIVYTCDMATEGGSTCHGFASLFAYMAKLCGVKNVYYCWSGYHGWAEIDGLIYDPVFLGSPHFTVVYGIPYGIARGMGLGTDYVEINRYKIPDFK